MFQIREKRKYMSAITVLYFVLRLINCFIQVSFIFIAVMYLVEALALITVNFRKIKLKAFNVLSAVIITSSTIVSIIIKREDSFELILLTILNIVFAYSMYKYGISRKATTYLFWIVIIVCSLRLLSGNADAVFLRASRNSISAFCILVAVLYYSTFSNDEYLPFLPAVITVLLSLIGEGRGGVISSVVLFCSIFLIDLFKRKRKFSSMVAPILALAIFGLLFFRAYDLFFAKAIDRMFSQSLGSNERVAYLEEYLTYAKRSAFYFIFGVPKSAIPIIKYLNGNFHNSFLALHSSFGIAGLVFIIVSLMTSIVRCIKQRNALLVFLIAVLCIRAFTDTVCFVNYYDPVLFYLMFKSVKYTEKSDLSKEGVFFGSAVKS